MSRENDVPKLDAVFWETINKVEVEVREELWEVVSDDKHNSQGSLVELLEASGNLLPWDHVVLEEGEQVDYEFLKFEPFLVKSVVLILGVD